jgi:hypothetical protein
MGTESKTDGAGPPGGPAQPFAAGPTPAANPEDRISDITLHHKEDVRSR